jgi:hypothetical protein
VLDPFRQLHTLVEDVVHVEPASLPSGCYQKDADEEFERWRERTKETLRVFLVHARLPCNILSVSSTLLRSTHKVEEERDIDEQRSTGADPKNERGRD